MAGPNVISLPRTERYCDLQAKEHTAMRQQRVFTDFTISTDNSQFPCHKVIVASVSPYLKALLTSDMVESAKLRVNFSHIKGEIMGPVMDYIYCGQIHFDTSQLMDMLEACHYLQIQELIEMCVGEVQAQLTPKNVLEYLRLGQKLELDSVQATSIQFMIENYTEVFEEQAFLFFSFIGVLDYFSHLQGSDVNHDAVLSAAMRWVKHDTDGRTKHLEELMNKVALEKCSHHSLLEVMEKYASVIAANVTVLTMMAKTMQKLLLQQDKQQDVAQKEVKTVQDTTTTSRSPDIKVTAQNITRPSKAKQKLAVVGGYVGFSVNSVCWMMNERNQFSQLTEIPPDDFKYAHSVCATDGGFIVTGGNDSDICYIFTAATVSWRKARKMLRKRWYHCSICIKGVLYVFGGNVSDRNATDTVDCMVLTQDNWEAGPRLPEPVYYPKVAEINGQLYLLNPKTKKLYQLDVESKVWTERAPIPRCDEEVSMASVKGKLAVMGSRTKICALYDPTSDAWTEGQQPKYPHWYGALVYHDDRLLLMGGRFFYTGTDKIEEYSLDDGTWSATDIKMPVQNLREHYALVLESPHND